MCYSINIFSNNTHIYYKMLFVKTIERLPWPSLFVFVVHGSKIQNSLHAYMILLKLPMNKRIDAFASLHKAYIKPT